MWGGVRRSCTRVIVPRSGGLAHTSSRPIGKRTNPLFRDELEGGIERAAHVLPEEMESWITFRDITVNTILKDKAKRGIWPPTKTERSMFEPLPEDQARQPVAEPGLYIPLSAIAENSTVFDAISKMQATRFGAVVILRADSKQHLELQANGKVPIHLQGIFTERDLLIKAIRSDKPPRAIAVTDVMTKEVTTVNPETTAARCMEMMTLYRFRHLPVIDANGISWGIISIGDIVKHILDEQRQTIHFLKEYIQRTY